MFQSWAFALHSKPVAKICTSRLTLCDPGARPAQRAAGEPTALNSPPWHWQRPPLGQNSKWRKAQAPPDSLQLATLAPHPNHQGEAWDGALAQQLCDEGLLCQLALHFGSLPMPWGRCRPRGFGPSTARGAGRRWSIPWPQTESASITLQKGQRWGQGSRRV